MYYVSHSEGFLINNFQSWNQHV